MFAVFIFSQNNENSALCSCNFWGNESALPVHYVSIGLAKLDALAKTCSGKVKAASRALKYI